MKYEFLYGVGHIQYSHNFIPFNYSLKCSHSHNESFLNIQEITVYFMFLNVLLQTKILDVVMLVSTSGLAIFYKVTTTNLDKSCYKTDTLKTFNKISFMVVCWLLQTQHTLGNIFFGLSFVMSKESLSTKLTPIEWADEYWGTKACQPSNLRVAKFYKVSVEE